MPTEPQSLPFKVDCLLRLKTVENLLLNELKGWNTVPSILHVKMMTWV